MVAGDIELLKRAQSRPRREPAAIPRCAKELECVLNGIFPVPLLHLGEDNRVVTVEDAGCAVEDSLLMTFDTFASNPFLYKDLKWDPVRDFAPLMQLCRYPQVLLVHPSLGVRSVPEFVALATQKGAQLNYGTAGPAAWSRLAYELFKEAAGIETVAIHYKGGGPAIQDLVSGQVQVMLIQGGGSIPLTLKKGG